MLGLAVWLFWPTLSISLASLGKGDAAWEERLSGPRALRDERERLPYGSTRASPVPLAGCDSFATVSKRELSCHRLRRAIACDLHYAASLREGERLVLETHPDSELRMSIEVAAARIRHRLVRTRPPLAAGSEIAEGTVAAGAPFSFEAPDDGI